MTPCEVDYALQTLMSKIKARELESQRAMNEHVLTNRLLKRQLQELQNRLESKESQLADANETIRALRSVTQIIAGLQDEIRALRTQLLTPQVHNHRSITTQIRNPAAISGPIRIQAPDDLSRRTLSHPTEAGPTCSDYISQNSSKECTLLKIISECGRTTEVAVPRVKEEEQEVEMEGGDEDGESEGGVAEETVKLENDGEWDGCFEYNHAAHGGGELPDKESSYTFSNHDLAAIEAATSASSSRSSDSAAVLNASNSRKRQVPDTPLDSQSASVMVHTALCEKLGGDRIFHEYNKMKCLSDGTRRKMVNILVADMMENHGRPPPASIRVSYALGIVTLFPFLKDLNSKNGYEHYYDPHSGSGYLAWRLKTVQRNSSNRAPRSLSTYQDAPRSVTTYQDGPKAQRPAHSAPPQLSAEQCQEAVSVMSRSADVALVKDNMKATFGHRQEMVHNPEMSSVVIDLFPRFMDTPGLVRRRKDGDLGDGGLCFFGK